MLVTPRSFARDDEALRERLRGAVRRVEYRQDGVLDPVSLRRLLEGVDGWIAGVERIDRGMLDHARRLKVIARYGVGVDNVDLRAAAEHGIVVTNTPGANAGAVAELVIGLFLALARAIPYADRRVRAGEWGRIDGIALEGKVVGLLGLGAVGREVAWRSLALGCRVRAYDPVAPEDYARKHRIELASRDEVIGGSDLLSLHVPVLPQTRGMVDAGFLAAMKPGAFLVNAARGELVDESALLEALRSGHLRGAALDALADEPPAPGLELARLDNVVITPHMGAHTDSAVKAMGWRAAENCLAVLRGASAPDLVLANGGAG